MECHEIQESILDALDGESSPEQQRAIDAHVSSCAACAQFAARQLADRRHARVGAGASGDDADIAVGSCALAFPRYGDGTARYAPGCRSLRQLRPRHARPGMDSSDQPVNRRQRRRDDGTPQLRRAFGDSQFVRGQPARGLRPVHPAARKSWRAPGPGAFRTVRGAPAGYQAAAGPLTAPDSTAFRTSPMVARPARALPPHSNRVAAGVQ